jgi:hypothetical protein
VARPPARRAALHRAQGNVILKTSCWRVGAERQKYLIDFSHGQEKDIAQKEKYRQEKTNPEKISSQKSVFRQEEDSEESCAEKRSKKESGRQEEIIGKKETGYKESHAPARRSHQSHYSQWASRSGSRVGRPIRRYTRPLPQKL